MKGHSVPVPEYWWQAIPAWPVDRESQPYSSLRRVWADHTMSAGRGLYRPRSEDHQTVVLFHSFQCLPAATWLPTLADTLGLKTVNPTTARIAYLHEETVPHHRKRYHGRDFVIADIVLNWSDDVDGGIISFEVKRQDGPAPTDKDFEKAKTYIEFDSMGGFQRRHAAFLVADRHKRSVEESWPHVVSWSEILEDQIAAASKVAANHRSLSCMPSLIEDLYASYGIGNRRLMTLPDPAALYETALRELVPIDLVSLTTGLAYSAHWRRGSTIKLPDAFNWFRQEPSEEQVRASKAQTTSDRRVIRWSENWKPEYERALRFSPVSHQ